jgi:hypothetical protein
VIGEEIFRGCEVRRKKRDDDVTSNCARYCNAYGLRLCREEARLGDESGNYCR